MPDRRTLLSLAVAAAAGGTRRPARAQRAELNGFDLRDALVPTDAIQSGGPPRDGIPAIDRPRYVDARSSGLADNDRVLGLALQGIARAYPIRILNWHEIVNDRLGDAAVAVTYCPLCGTGIAFDARVAGQVARFGVSGLLFNSDVLLYDRATESLWSQILAQAVSGPLKGTRLTPVPLTHTSWADWRRRHPRTEVLSTDTGFVRDYTRDPYDGYDRTASVMFDVQHRDDRLHPKAWVLGLRIGDEAKAYPFDTLARRVGADGTLADRLGGQAVRIRYDAAHRNAEAFDDQGRPLAGVTAFWFAWVAFHPGTLVLQAP
jgi:hypothetical protein